jgi:hypothetical protein
MSEKNQALELLRAMNEMLQGFKQTAPLLREMLIQMGNSIGGRDAYGYMNVITKLDAASEDERDILVILCVQWISTVLEEAKQDAALKDILMGIFPNGVLKDLL